MEAQYELLKQFTHMLKANPSILHDPKLGFFKDYLMSMGATIPEKTAEKKESPPPKAAEPEPEDVKMEVDEEQMIPYPELDNSGVIEADSGEELAMGEEGKEATEEESDQANEARDRAMAAFSDGNFEEAVKEFTTAISLNPGSAMMHAKRANALLKLKKPVAAIADCNMAIKINPDSAQGYKFRGRANRLLGKWVEAHADLAMACKLDYDDLANEWMKEVEPNAKKLQEYNRSVARAKEEKELKERRERVRRAQEANAKAAAESAKRHAAEGMADDDQFGGMPGAMPGFGDPEMAALFEDPDVSAALEDIMTNPANAMKHMSNPKVAKALGKLQGMFGGKMPGFGGFPGASGGFPGASGGCPNAHCQDDACGGGAPPPPTKAPEPDLD